MHKLTFQKFEGLPMELNAAEEAYEDASARRRQSIRRRTSRKPRNYQERQKLEEEKRKEPLVRRYVVRELNQLENNAFYKPSALETPILLDSTIIGNKKTEE